jgi:hypothetical protein
MQVAELGMQVAELGRRNVGQIWTSLGSVSTVQVWEFI